METASDNLVTESKSRWPRHEFSTPWKSQISCQIL